MAQLTTMPIYRWNAVSGAINYRCQVWSDYMMNNSLFGESVGTKTETPTSSGWINNWNSIAYDDTVYWSVRYQNADLSWSDYAPTCGAIKIQGSPPKLSVSSDTVIVSSSGTSILSIGNSGGGYLDWSVPDKWKTPWIEMSSQFGSLQGNQSVNVQISGTAPEGNRLGYINIQTNAGTSKEIVVIYTNQEYDFAYINWLDSQPEVGVGINPINESFTHFDKTSFSIPGSSFDLEFSHTYNSPTTETFRPVPSSNGVGWMHSYSFFLEKLADKMVLYYPNGNMGMFKLENNKYTSLVHSNKDSLYGSGSYRYIKTKGQIVYKFTELDVNSGIFYLLNVTDRNGNVLTMNYDNDNKLTRITSPENRSLTLAYHESTSNWPGFIKSVSDYTGRKVGFFYDYPDNNLTKYVNLAGDTTYYEYVDDGDELNLLKKIKLPKGNWIENNYNDRKVASQSVSGMPGSLIVTKSNATTRSITDQLGNITKIEYDSPDFGNVSKIVTADKDTVKYEYADTLNPNQPTKFTDELGNWVKYQYDARGNLLKENKPYGVSSSYVYNGKSDMTKITGPNGNSVTYNYDSKGNLTSTQSYRGTSSVTYNSNGTVKNVTDIMGRKTYYSYNSLYDLTQIKDNVNNTVTFTYDNLSRLKTQTNPNNQTSSWTYLVNDLPKTATDPSGNTISYVYDKNENLLALINQNGDSTKYEYDDSDLLTKTINPLKNFITYDYNDLGYVSSKKSKDGALKFDFTYDSNNRLTTIRNAKSVDFEYYKNGMLKRAYTASNKEMKYEYDSLGRITKFYNYDYSTPITYAYDQSSNVTSVTYEPGKTVYYTYYTDNLLSTVRDWNNQYTRYYYNNDGSIDYLTNQNGTQTHYDYDNLGRVVSLLNKKSNGDTITYYKNEYSNIGNITSMEYIDPLPMPNQTSKTTSYSYNEGNQLTASSDFNYGYDDNGNNTSRTGTTNATLTYNVDDKLTNLVDGNESFSYEYDIFNNRISATRNGKKTKYIHNGNNSLSQVLIEIDATTGQKTYYIYGASLIIRIKSNGTSQWYHGDLRANVTAMTNTSQTITHKYIYDAFGCVMDMEEPANDENLYRFLGIAGITYEKDDLYFIRARFYDPTTGRFISEDPKWNTNLYAYGNGNPVRFVDVDGQLAWDISLSFFRIQAGFGVNLDGIYLSTGLTTDKGPSLFLGGTTGTPSVGDYSNISFGASNGTFGGEHSISLEDGEPKMETKFGLNFSAPGVSAGASTGTTRQIYSSDKVGAWLWKNIGLKANNQAARFAPTTLSKVYYTPLHNSYKKTGRISKRANGVFIQFESGGQYKWVWQKYRSSKRR